MAMNTGVEVDSWQVSAGSSSKRQQRLISDEVARVICGRDGSQLLKGNCTLHLRCNLDRAMTSDLRSSLFQRCSKTGSVRLPSGGTIASKLQKD